MCNPVNIPTGGYGGTPKVVYSLARNQAEAGHDVMVLAGRPSDIPGVTDASFAEGRPYVEKKFIADRMVTAYSLRAILRSRRHEFDIVHSHISDEAIPMSLLSKSKVITTLHCPLTLRSFWPFVTTSLSSILPRKTKLITISERALEAYRPFYGDDLLGFIHNGLDISAIPFSPTPETNYEIQMAFLGKLVYEKYPHVAIQIADIIRSWKHDIKLLVMGKLDSPLSAYGQKLVSMIDQRDYVELLPNMPTEDVYRVLAQCHVFLNPAFEIGLIMSQLEALAIGTPVVGFVNGSAREVVSGGVNGYLGSDLDDIAKGCLLAQNLEREKCRKSVSERFSEERMYREYMQLYAYVTEQG